MPRRSDRDWDETVTGDLMTCTLCPFKACKDCPDKKAEA